MVEKTGNRSVSQALDILETLSASYRPMTVTELSSACGVTRMTVYKALETLLTREYVVRMGNGYLLSGRLFELGARFRGGSPLVARFRRYGALMPKRFSCSLCLAVPSRPGKAVLLDVLGSEALGTQSTPLSGSPLPFHATSMGKTIFAFADEATRERTLRQTGPYTRYTSTTIVEPEHLRREVAAIRRNRLARDCGEYIHRVWSVTAPAFDRQGTLVAGIALSGTRDVVESSFPSLVDAIRSLAVHIVE